MSNNQTGFIENSQKVRKGIYIVFGIFFLLIIIAGYSLDYGEQGDNGNVSIKTSDSQVAIAETGDMIVVSNSNRTNACILIVKKQAPELLPPQMSATFPIGRCAEADAYGNVWYSSIVSIVGNNGILLVIPKKNTARALQAMLGMAVNFQH